ncbi:MAG TPA: adenosylcobinamide-phosphate synthase CbiB [Steroidobacteraceae bacterium]|nr:adenosylcobinamide-phosphate synthase CbiB [Steroidobacteraceae bacterium]
MTDASLRAGAIVVAFALDRLFGEPPARLHPVVWIGKALGAVGAPWPRLSSWSQFLRGAVAWILGGGVVFAAATLAVMLLQRLPRLPPWTLLAQALILGVLLKPLLAWRMLRDEVAGVECALVTGLEEGRSRLSRLVSRDTRRLSAGQVRESALESLAENLNDSLVAPLFWFSLGGLPAAALYRFANTADAMWGYRDRWEWAGKWAARADDLLSYLPARLTALLLALTGWRSPSGLRAQARLTPSPNGGWPMGMLALALGVRLSKPGVYALNADGSEPGAAHIDRAIGICTRAAWLAAGCSAAVLVMVGCWS